jgi:hypothetical protein
MQFAEQGWRPDGDSSDRHQGPGAEIVYDTALSPDPGQGRMRRGFLRLLNLIWEGLLCRRGRIVRKRGTTVP